MANKSTNMMSIVDITATLKFKYSNSDINASTKHSVSDLVMFFSQYLIHNPTAMRQPMHSTSVMYDPYHPPLWTCTINAVPRDIANMSHV